MADIHTSTTAFADDYKNPRGIPRMEFVACVEDMLKARGVQAETVVKQFQEQHSKYKLMEHKLTQNLALLKSKLPEIKKNIDTIDFLARQNELKEGFDTHVGMTDLVFCEAAVPPTNTVHLWLGANVMVEFTLEEAKALLTKNLTSAEANMKTTEEDLAWLRDQIVVCEVNTSRVYNYDVVKRRDEKEGKK